MVSVAIGTAGAISAYLFQQAFTSYSLNESDPIKGELLPLPYYLWVFGCGLVFWLLVLLWPTLCYSGGVVSLHIGDKGPRQNDIREVAKLNTAITTINLCGFLVLPFRKLPLLVRFLVLFQLSSYLALLIICALLSIHNYIMLLNAGISKSTEYWRRRKQSPPKYHCHPTVVISSTRTQCNAIRAALSRVFTMEQSKAINKAKSDVEGNRGETRPPANLYADRGDGYDGEAGAGGRKHAGDGDGGEAVTSGSKHGGDGYGGDGGEGGGGQGRGDPEHGVRERNKEPTFKISKISEMSVMLTAQTSATLIGFYLTTPSFSTKALLVVVLVDQLVGYLCGLTSILIEHENERAARNFERVGFACTAMGYILMVAMFVHWYLVLIVVLLFGVVWSIFFQRVWYPLIINTRS